MKNAGVEKILIGVGKMVGDISKQYIDFPITANSWPEQKVREQNMIIEELILTNPS
jgi:hypothetical protein